MMTELGQSSIEQSTVPIRLGNVLTASLDSLTSLGTTFINNRRVYTFFSGDEVSLPISLQKNSRNFTISETDVVYFTLVSEVTNKALIPPQRVLPTLQGNDWNNSLVICTLSQNLTEELAEQPVSIEVEVSGGFSKNTFRVSGLFIRKDSIL